MSTLRHQTVLTRAWREDFRPDPDAGIPFALQLTLAAIAELARAGIQFETLPHGIAIKPPFKIIEHLDPRGDLIVVQDLGEPQTADLKV